MAMPSNCGMLAQEKKRRERNRQCQHGCAVFVVFVQNLHRFQKTTCCSCCLNSLHSFSLPPLLLLSFYPYDFLSSPTLSLSSDAVKITAQSKGLSTVSAVRKLGPKGLYSGFGEAGGVDDDGDL